MRTTELGKWGFDVGAEPGSGVVRLVLDEYIDAHIMVPVLDPATGKVSPEVAKMPGPVPGVSPDVELDPYLIRVARLVAPCSAVHARILASHLMMAADVSEGIDPRTFAGAPGSGNGSDPRDES